MADGLPDRPAPELTPPDVIGALLSAFQSDDRERAVRTAFNFAAPELRSSHRGLEGFDWYLANPVRLPLLDWSQHRRGSVITNGVQSIARIMSYGADESRTFRISLRQQQVGKYEGCWMITAFESITNEAVVGRDEVAYVATDGECFACDRGENLREVLLSEPGMSPHNGVAGSVNCGGNGVCGTCAVEVRGETNERTSREKSRLSLPTHDEAESLRLACQTELQGDVTVRKPGGFFGDDRKSQSLSTVKVTQAEYDGEYDYETE